MIVSFAVACATGEGVDDSGNGGGGGTASGGGGSGGSSGSGAVGGAATGGAGGLPSGGAGGSSGGSGGGGATGGTGGIGGTGGSTGGGGGTGGAGGSVGGSGGAATCDVVGCLDGSESGAGCLGARVVGRKSASKAGGFQVSGSTCNAGNDVSGYGGTSCPDGGKDRAYRLYLKKNEKLDVLLTQGAKCVAASSWERVFEIYSGSSCTDKGCSKKVQCSSTGAGTWSTTFVAPDDGWYVVVVDGKTANDGGDFTLTLSLLCIFGGCEC
ncbi:MAG: hypothetical protein IT377_12130 [Polyangiaceae bacterium]|nr:hypothetical protein [Polyangiaceae bacterium]